MQAVIDRLLGVVVADLSKHKDLAGIDTAGGGILPLIIGLLPTILQLFQSCIPPVPPAPAAAIANRPNLLRRFQLRAVLRDQVPGNDADTIALRGHLFDALLVAGASVTEADMTAVAVG